MGLDLSALLPSLAGAARGYSSGSGLDLAMRLREQAALDDLAIEKYGKLQDIREQGIIDEENRKQQLLRQQQHEASVANILANLPTARVAGINLEGFEAPDLVERLLALTPQQSAQLDAALTGEVSGKAFEISSERAAAEAKREALESEAGVIKDLSGAELNAARAAHLRRNPAYKTSDFKFHYTSEGVFTTFYDKAVGRLVTLEVPEVTGDVRAGSGVEDAAMSSVTKHYIKVREESQNYPARYAMINPETGEIMKDEDGNPIMDEEKIRQTAEARARKDLAFAYGSSPGPVSGDDTTAPGGDGFGLDIEMLKASGMTPEEIELFIDLETGIGSP